MKNARRFIQIIRAFMLASIFVYLAFVFWLPSSDVPNPLMFRAVTLMSIVMLLLVFIMRRIQVVPAERSLATGSQDANLQLRWRQGYLVTYVLSESIALNGLVLHFFGNPSLRVMPFLVVAAGLIFFYAPPAHDTEFPPDKIAQ